MFMATTNWIISQNDFESKYIDVEFLQNFCGGLTHHMENNNTENDLILP